MTRVGHVRNYERERRASELYEQLSVLTMDELYERAGLTNPKGHPRGRYHRYARQQLIATIIEKRLEEEDA